MFQPSDFFHCIVHPESTKTPRRQNFLSCSKTISPKSTEVVEKDGFAPFENFGFFHCIKLETSAKSRYVTKYLIKSV